MNESEISAMAKEAKLTDPYLGDWGIPSGYAKDEILRFAALVAAVERERMAAQLVSIGDGYGIRDKGLDAITYSRMQETAYEHAAVILTNGAQWSALSAAQLESIRARGVA